MSPPLPRVLLAVVTDGRPEMNLQCCVSIMHAQLELITAGETGFAAELVFVERLNDALDRLHKDESCAAAFVLRHNAYVPGIFALKACRSGEKVVISPSPRPSVDWARVKEKCATSAELPQHVGNAYNAKLEGLPRPDGYAAAKGVEWVDGLFVRREVVDDIASKFPEIVSPEKSSFALDGVHGGRFVPGTKRFFEMYGGEVWADVENQSNVSGPQDFVGCVGARKILR
jgi:hypothetical protein